jgi:hypothetical protein
MRKKQVGLASAKGLQGASMSMSVSLKTRNASGRQLSAHRGTIATPKTTQTPTNIPEVLQASNGRRFCEKCTEEIERERAVFNLLPPVARLLHGSRTLVPLSSVLLATNPDETLCVRHRAEGYRSGFSWF